MGAIGEEIEVVEIPEPARTTVPVPDTVPDEERVPA